MAIALFQKKIKEEQRSREFLELRFHTTVQKKIKPQLAKIHHQKKGVLQ